MDCEVRDRQEISENLPDSNGSEMVITVRSEDNEDERSDLKSDTDMGSKVCLEDLKENVEPGTDACVVDVKYSKNLSSRDGEAEKVCRICHLSSDGRSGSQDMIELGCKCKDDLAAVHRHCAEAWFKIKGSRCCEICSEIAKNITGVGDTGFMQEQHSRDMGSDNNSSSERVSCWKSPPFCNFLMTCLIIAFILPWFFRINMF